MLCILASGINLRGEKNEDQIMENVKNVLTRNQGFDEEEVQQEFGKCHRVGPVKYGQQTTIARFKSYRFKEEVYKKRKTTKNKKIKTKLLLTRTRTKTLNYAYEVTNENLEIFNFAFPDPNGNLKFRLKNSINRKSDFSFRNLDDINEIIKDLGWKRPGEEIDESNDINID